MSANNKPIVDIISYECRSCVSICSEFSSNDAFICFRCSLLTAQAHNLVEFRNNFTAKSENVRHVDLYKSSNWQYIILHRIRG